LTDSDFLKEVYKTYQHEFLECYVKETYFKNEQEIKEDLLPLIEKIQQAPFRDLLVLFAVTTTAVRVDENQKFHHMTSLFNRGLISETLALRGWTNRKNLPNFIIQEKHRQVLELIVLNQLETFFEQFPFSDENELENESIKGRARYYKSLHARTLSEIALWHRTLEPEYDAIGKIKEQLLLLLESSSTSLPSYTVGWLEDYVGSILLLLPETEKSDKEEIEEILTKIVLEEKNKRLHFNFLDDLQLATAWIILKNGVSTSYKIKNLKALTNFVLYLVDELPSNHTYSRLPFTPKEMLTILEGMKDISPLFVEKWEFVQKAFYEKNIEIILSSTMKRLSL